MSGPRRKPSPEPDAGVTELDLSGAELVPTESIKLGRYELVLELGSGGMASVHLARTRGPAGFHKWFAVKRIHPHLGKDQRFVDMFLDEARIAAAVEHPNVAQVVELGEDGDSFYLAMEYLHGEHLGRVASRAAKESGHLDYAVAAAMIGGAANGLHAAHEGLDAQGQPLDLVHRDVSPQNIFVTYDGRVKVTDFGVAKAANRISHTQTGTAKGKVAYMAPEQALGQPIDRRTDLFALGIVLWEITTGRRLFKSETDAQTLMRITGGKVPRPSTLNHDYPPELERIVLKALALRPQDRYPSAAAMARDLERFASSGPEPVTQRVRAETMGRLFADTKPARDQMLRITAGKPTLSPAAALSVDDLPMIQSESRTLPLDAARAAVPASSRWHLWLVAGLGLALAAAIGAVVALLSARPDERDAPVTALPTEPAPDVPAPAASETPEPAPTETPEPAPTEPTPAAAGVRIRSTPAGATVVLDEMEVDGATPVTVEDVGPGRHEVRLSLAGHEPRTERFEATAGEVVELNIALSAAPVAATEPSARPAMEPTMSAARDVAPGTLVVTAFPWAAVTVGGRTQNTPATFEVRPGRVAIRYQVGGEGPTRRATARVQSGRTESLRLDTR